MAPRRASPVLRQTEWFALILATGCGGPPCWDPDDPGPSACEEAEDDATDDDGTPGDDDATAADDDTATPDDDSTAPPDDDSAPDDDTTAPADDDSTAPPDDDSTPPDDDSASTDADGDGHPAETDCDDGDPEAHPGAAEVCGDAVDQDCDGSPDCPLVEETSLSAVTGFRLDGFTGVSSVAACDLDLDGTADLVVAESGDPPGAGIHVYSGPFAGTRDKGEYDALVMSGGDMTALCEDVDGDGSEDLVVGTESPMDGRGHVSVLFAPVTGTIDIPDSDVEWSAADVEDLFPLKGGMDLDGDGFGDLVAGSASASAGKGVVWVIPGGPDVPTGSVDLGEAYAWYEGLSTTSALGLGGASPDLTGDGSADLVLLSAAVGDGYEAAYVLDGPLPPGGRTAASAASTTFQAGIAAAGFALGGDFDDDGGVDLALGDPDDGAAGRVFVFDGPVGGGSLGAAEARVDLDGAPIGFGAAMAQGDVDGNGTSDLVVLSPDEESVARIYFGPMPDGIVPYDPSPVRVVDDGGSSVILAVAVAEVNGDGHADLLFTVGVVSPSAVVGVWGTERVPEPPE